MSETIYTDKVLLQPIQKGEKGGRSLSVPVSYMIIGIRRLLV